MMRRRYALLLTLAMFFTGISLPLRGQAGVAVEAASLAERAGSQDGMIRVALSSISGKGTYNLTLTGSYTMGGTSLASGSSVKVEFSGGTVYVTAGGSCQAMGSSATLSRKSGGVKINESLAPSSIYPGDLRFFYSSSGTAMIVCTLYIEDYVYGVLPYEMDNSFPLEALKAQAVAARTYAIRAKSSSGSYDVTDTTTHQVFRGVNYSKTRCIQAVDETWGIVIEYNGTYAGAYYSASNGGQTEDSRHVWGGSSIAYLDIHDDPFDVANPYSVKKSYMIYRSAAEGNSLSAYNMIKSALASKLGGTADQYSIEMVTDVLLHTPLYAAPSKLYSRMQVSVRYNNGQTATVDIPIFPTVEKTLGLSINGGNNELYSVDIEEKGFRVSARRFGHGVGMSQRGAEQMANDGYSYAQIIGFYYPGVTRTRLDFTTNWPGSTTVPVKAPDAAGVMAETEAIVTLETQDHRLNVRKSADENADILVKVANGTTITVLSQTGDWAKVRVDGVTGYAAAQYLKTVQAEPVATQTPAQGPTATVSLTNKNETVNLRLNPSLDAPVLSQLWNGTAVTVLENGAEWTKAAVMGSTGYIMTQYLTGDGVSADGSAVPVASIAPVVTTPPVETAQTNTAFVATNDGDRLNLRRSTSSSGTVLDRIPNGTEVEVVETGDKWTKVRYNGFTGYVATQYLTKTRAAAPQTGQTAAPADDSTRYVTTEDNSNVYLRREASKTSDRLATIPTGTAVTLLAGGESWSQVFYKGQVGYMASTYLTLTPPQGAQPAVLESNATAVQGDASTESVIPPANPQPQPASDTAQITGDKTQVINTGKAKLNSPTAKLHLKAEPYDLADDTGGTLSQGAQVEVLQYVGSDAMWVYVRSGSAQGYALREHFQLNQGIAAVALGDPSTQVTVRAKANTSSDAVAKLSHGTLVTVTSTENGWSKVKLGDGTTGYIAKEYLAER